MAASALSAATSNEDTNEAGGEYNKNDMDFARKVNLFAHCVATAPPARAHQDARQVLIFALWQRACDNDISNLSDWRARRDSNS